jgi:hypothetical protein
MRISNDLARFGPKVHVRTPIVLLLPSDLKKVFRFVRTVVEGHHHPYSARVNPKTNASSSIPGPRRR